MSNDLFYGAGFWDCGLKFILCLFAQFGLMNQPSESDGHKNNSIIIAAEHICNQYIACKLIPYLIYIFFLSFIPFITIHLFKKKNPTL